MTFLDPDFLIGHAISAIWGRFLLIFALDKLNARHIFYFRSSWPTDLESVTWCAPHGDSFNQVWSWYDHPLPSYSVIAADTLRDLDFWLCSVVIHGGSRGQPLHQVWRSYGSPFLSSDISHTIPLTGEGRSHGGKISGEMGRPPANVLIPLERQLNALQLCRWQFLYTETLQQTFRPSLSKSSKRRQI